MKLTMRILLLAMLCFPLLAVHAQDNVQSELERFIAEIAPEDAPAVSVRITVGDDTWAAAGGLVDVTSSGAATPDSAFRIASMSKTWLAVAVMQLSEQGILALDDTVSQWLPENITGNIANAADATIEQLLTMTSGIPDYLNTEFFDAILQDTTYSWTPEEALTYAHNLPESFALGEGFEYSNSNYVLLQLIVEAAAGKPMHEVLREQIFTPLQLEDTYVQIQEQGTPFVHGYEDIDGDGEAEDVTDYNDGAGLGDGALVSTTADLTRFYQALFVTGELLSEESVQQMIDAGDNENDYGIGLEVIERENGLNLGHTGAVLGFTGAVFYNPNLDATVVILYGSNALDEEHVLRLLEIAAKVRT